MLPSALRIQSIENPQPTMRHSTWIDGNGRYIELTQINSRHPTMTLIDCKKLIPQTPTEGGEGRPQQPAAGPRPCPSEGGEGQQQQPSAGPATPLEGCEGRLGRPQPAAGPAHARGRGRRGPATAPLRRSRSCRSMTLRLGDTDICQQNMAGQN